MKHTLRTSALVACLVVAASVASAQQNPTSARMDPEQMNSQMAAGNASPNDRIFLDTTAAGGMAEVQFSQLALEKSSNPDVKKFAHQMIDDHTSMAKDLEPVAKIAGAELPTKPAKSDQKEAAKLSTLSGVDFDKEYLSVMLKGHHKTLEQFQMQNTRASSVDVKRFANQHLNMLKTHTDEIDKLAKLNGVS